MAAIYDAETPWHAGEEEMHRLLKVPYTENPTSPFLSPHAANLLIRSPLVSLGTLDSEDWPWTTIWGGEAGFAQPVAQSIIGMNTTVERVFDPVLETLFEGKADGEVIREEGRGRMVSGLAFDLQNRRRVKLYGRMIAGALSATEDGIGNVQLVVKIEQSLGNCPKYMNKKQIIPSLPRPILVTTDTKLPQSALELLSKADTFFISSSNRENDMDTNIRGGPAGFVRVLSNELSDVVLVWPEYSGNRLYQTLGNLLNTPRAGMVFPDFDTGDVLYITGTTEILVGKAAASLIAHTNIAVKIRVHALRFVTSGLAFRGQSGDPSPYNPSVRYLSTESQKVIVEENLAEAVLISRDLLTPKIARLKFRMSGATKPKWKAGQYVALDFRVELDDGYSHMRDDDPKSINDDFIRTFTVSSPDDGTGEFAITIRNVGKATNLLFRQNIRSGLELPVRGFGGEFHVDQNEENVGFIASGVGITPLLPQLQSLDLERLTLYWSIQALDLDLVVETFNLYPDLSRSTHLFVTGKTVFDTDKLTKLQAVTKSVTYRRMEKDDYEVDEKGPVRWYLCTGPELKKSLLEWLAGKRIFYEDFNY